MGFSVNSIWFRCYNGGGTLAPADKHTFGRITSIILMPRVPLYLKPTINIQATKNTYYLWDLQSGSE